MQTFLQTPARDQTTPIDFESLFSQFIYFRDSQSGVAHLDELGLWLQRQLSCATFPSLDHLPFKSGNYTRTYISKEPSNELTETSAETIFKAMFEALVMRWDQQSKTSIHGHPKFSFYHVINGMFEIELFDKTATGQLYTKEIQQLRPADSTWFLGDSCCYDNCIHRVTCLEPGLTFHVYSDDALKGTVFE